MQVKLTYTFSAACTIAPILIMVLWLNERELLKDQCLSIKIEGLCVNEGGVRVGSKQKGILMFMQGYKKIDKERYRIYRYKVLLPFIKKKDQILLDWMESLCWT